MKHEDSKRQVPVGKSIKGSAIYGEDGSYIFTPYEEGKPENAHWVPLATVENGKLECTKKKVRMVLTMNRADLPLVVSTFTRAFGKLAGKTSDSRVKKMYKLAVSASPHEIKAEKVEEEKEEEIPTFG